MRLASRFGRYNSIRRERPLTDDELMQFVPSVFSGDKHESRSERYTYIPTINIINKLRDEGFQPFFACQSRVRDLGRREYSKRHCCKVSDEAAFCLIQRPYISKTLLTRRISPRGSP